MSQPAFPSQWRKSLLFFALLIGAIATSPSFAAPKQGEIAVHQLTLYYFQACPYCQKVLRFLQGHPNLASKIVLKDIRQSPQAREELQRIGGKTQVPCLVIDGKALYESDDIIEWLKKQT